MEDLRELAIESSAKKSVKDDSNLKPKKQVPLELAAEKDVGPLTTKRSLITDLEQVHMEE